MSVPTLIPNAVATEAIDLAKKIADLIAPYTVILTLEERKKMAKASNKSYSFLQKGEEYSESDPQFLPPFTTSLEIKNYLTNFDTLRPLMQVLNQVNSDVNDTSMFNSSNCYTIVLQYYKLSQQGAKRNVKNAKEISKDLSARFARKTKKVMPKNETNKLNDEGNGGLSKVA